MITFILENSSKSIYGGGQKVTFDVIRILKNKNNNVFLFDDYQSSYFSSKCVGYIDGNFKLFSFGGLSYSNFLKKIFEIISFPVFLALNFFVVVNVFIRLKYISRSDVIIYASTKKTLFLAFLLKIFGFSFIYHNHMVSKNKLQKYIVSFLCRFSNKTLCVSNVVKSDICHSKSVLIYNYFNHDLLAKVKSLKCRDNYNVFFVGSLIYDKGFDIYLKVAEHFSFSDKFRFFVCGQGPLDYLLKEYAFDNLINLGFVENVPSLLKDRCDLLLFPSKISEACPLAPIEAMSLGIPVITTNFSGQLEIVGNNLRCLSVNRNNYSEIISQIEHVFYNGYENFSEQALSRAKDFDYQIFEQKLIEVFNG